MFLYLNISGVIIDIVEDAIPVRKNINNIIIPCYPDKAQGYMGTNEKIYAKVGYNFIPQFNDIQSFAEVSEVPEYVQPLKYKYIDGEFVQNTDPYEEDGLTLTSNTNKNTADIDYIMIMEDL